MIVPDYNIRFFVSNFFSNKHIFSRIIYDSRKFRPGRNLKESSEKNSFLFCSGNDIKIVSVDSLASVYYHMIAGHFRNKMFLGSKRKINFFRGGNGDPVFTETDRYSF